MTTNKHLQELVGKTIEKVEEHSDETGLLRIDIITTEGKRVNITVYDSHNENSGAILSVRGSNAN